MSDTAITLTIDGETAEALGLLADLHDSTIEECAGRYLKLAVIEAKENFEAFIEEGERDIREGRVYTGEEMKRWFDEEIAKARAASQAKAA